MIELAPHEEKKRRKCAKEEQLMMKVMIDIVVLRMSTARKPYNANMCGEFMMVAWHASLEWKQRNHLCAASPGTRW